MGLFIAFLILNIVVIVHEFGHFIAARLAQIPVTTFSLGMGPKLFSIGILRMPGAEHVFTVCFETGKFHRFFRHRVWIHDARHSIDRCVCRMLMWITGSTVWELRLLPIGGFIEPKFSKDHPRRFAESLVLFGGPAANMLLFLLGSVGIFVFLRDLNIADACLKSLHLFTEISWKIVDDIGQTILGKKEPEFMGPVGIVATFGEHIDQTDGLLKGFGFMLILSLSLGIFNLIPIPPLDGGKLVFTWLRALNEKIGERLEIATSTLGILALFVLMIGVTVKDILALF